MSPIRPLTARHQPAAILAVGAAMVALLLMSGCGDKGRREPGNPFIGPSGADHSQPFGALPVVGEGDGRVAQR